MVFSHLMGSPVYTRRQLAGQIYRHMHLAAAGRSGYSAASQCVGLDEAMFERPQVSAGFHRKQAEDESMKSRKKKRLKADVKSLEVQRDMALAFIKSEKGQKVFCCILFILVFLMHGSGFQGNLTNFPVSELFQQYIGSFQIIQLISFLQTLPVYSHLFQHFYSVFALLHIIAFL